VIHFGRQAKHLPGQPNYDPSRSLITVSISELQDLVEYAAGTGTRRGVSRETVDFGVLIGLYRDLLSGRLMATTWGTIHYSARGVHVVPADPNVKKGG
jgi:hypothetical protein